MGNLVRRTDSFIGRTRERNALTRLVRSHRLVTVTGPPGVGKTRLAIEVAGALNRVGGVWFIDLTAVLDPTQVDQAVAGAMGVESRDSSAREALAGHLASLQALLVLDNCEHVIDSCADLLAWLLPRCPSIRVVTTSREALRIAGEHVYTLGPLDDLDDALRLFADRAAAADSEFVLTPAVSDLCRRLDGLPLAIELAARRVQVLHLTGLADLLREGDPSGSHPSLEAAIRWSYQLLAPDEQVALRRLSVLAGRFGVEEAAAACDVADVVEPLVSLTNKSLVAVDDGKFRLLEAIRMFGQARLREHGETDTTFARLVDHFAREVEPQSVRAYPDMATLRSWCERASTLAAVTDWATRNNDPRAAMLTWSLAVTWVLMGHVVETRALVLSGLKRDASPQYRAPLLSVLAILDDWAGQRDRARETLWQVARIEEALGRPGRLARAHCGLGVAYERMDDLDRARQHHLAALALVRQIDEQPAVAHTLYQLGHIAYLQGDLDTAAAELEEACRILDTHEMTPLQVAALWHGLGEVELARGDIDTAQRYFAETIRAAPNVPVQLVHGLQGLAAAAVMSGQPERALKLAEAALVVQRDLGTPERQWQRSIDATIAHASAKVSSGRIQTIRTAARRMSVAQIIDYALDGVQEATSPLSLRQLEICRSVANGQTDRQIANDFGVSTRTVSTYLEQIREQLGVHSRAEIAAWIAQQDAR
ncbi:hypothetical protein Lesp02_36790 [Lentzea sp. NBRC 105346]|uniref:ATP-binding protein n=1 Tax=Lentzea sp. NBRC 105346 TaxID=3032205 RepID=UPI0024A2967B|nr:tetratricopeptide repeat protein [Lentzea sp. NBRC 105346]GLZ31491.1 hypothetical protein Lesp02_36790 [Lentzea sp. NBRC 105346]